MRRLLACIIVFSTPWSLSAQDVSRVDFLQNTAAGKLISLDGPWHYIIDPYETGFRKSALAMPAGAPMGGYFEDRHAQLKSDLLEYDFAKAPTLQVPGDWNSQNEQLKYYEGSIWYERGITLHPKNGKRYFLHLGAVNYEAVVAVNGLKAGMHAGGFTPFDLDITRLIKEGQNDIVILVNNARRPERVPAPDFDWWNYGGLTRSASIIETGSCFIRDYEVQLAKGDTSTISGYVQVDGGAPGQELEISIPEAGLNIRVNADARGYATFRLPAKNITYWSPKNPKLYQTILATKGDTVKDRIGFKSITVKGAQIYLNGKPIFLRGINVHEEDPTIPGRPRTEAEARKVLGWARELHCNFLRLAHYPHSEWMARLADEMGFLLWEEVPVYWSIDWSNPQSLNIAEQQLTELIRRDKNRASVAIWSIGNETPKSIARNLFMEAMADTARKLDDTRLISAAFNSGVDANHGIGLDDTLARTVDVIGLNEYCGWYYDTPAGIVNYHFKVPYGQPVIISEFGGGALSGYHGDSATRFSEEYQALIYKNQLRVSRTMDQLCGMTPWILVDFRSPKRLNPTYQQGWNRKGLVGSNGKKKQAFYVLQAYYGSLLH